MPNQLVNIMNAYRQNQTNPHNILTQTNIGVAEEVRVQLSNDSNLKRNIRRW